jgi:hypothetical protein
MPEQFDAGDKAKVTTRKTKLKLARERELQELREILSTVGGRWTIWRIMSECGIFHSNPERSDTGRMASFEGSRDRGLWLLGEVFEADPKIFTVMRAEAEERKNG